MMLTILSVASAVGGFAAGTCCYPRMKEIGRDELGRLRAAGICCGAILFVTNLLIVLCFFVAPPPLSMRVSGPPEHHRNDAKRSIYLGQGCFWHTQYDTVVLEQRPNDVFGGRTNLQVSSLVGYAGGQYQSLSGTACYHSLPHTDYSRMGHAEAVSVSLDIENATIARSQVAALAKLYFEHGYNTVNGRRQRLDPQDMGAEYRNVIGLPGGMSNADWWPLFEAANVYGMPLVEGKGGLSGDTEGEYIVYVYDSNEFPFFRGERSHQFHANTVLGRPVPRSYLYDLKNDQIAIGRLDEDIGCFELPFTELMFLIIFLFALLCTWGGVMLFTLLVPLARWYWSSGRVDVESGET
eukprot:TRINITY_DN17101_c0_g1_i1.p1 TRINITY_DN17101_c0_g1~~TRINITY_DN17101_c0_g1_i1.p1  ORF type:complete len:352 (+),score=38.41 TRINITY_DN17101_c0_g1_i1:58-1113(+)